MTATEVETPRTDEALSDQRTGRMLPAAVAVGGLWLATALSSIFAPNLISDSQDHVSIVAITIWPWAAAATGLVLFGAAFPARDPMARWGLPVAVVGIWGAVALVSIVAPTIIADSDQTIVPVAGLFAPVVGAVATGVRVPGGRLVGRIRAASLSIRPNQAAGASQARGALVEAGKTRVRKTS